MTDTKPCTKCKVVKPLRDFYRRGEGYRRRCKSCHDAVKRAWNDLHRESVRQAKARWERANPEKRRAAGRRQYIKNREQKLERMRKYGCEQKRRQYAANPEKFKERVRRRQHLHPECGRRAVLTRRARRKAADVFKITPKDLWRLMNDPCYICGAPSEHIDHIIPLARGGRHSIGNLAPACPPCNHRKHTKFLIEFKAQINAEAA